MIFVAAQLVLFITSVMSMRKKGYFAAEEKPNVQWIQKRIVFVKAAECI